MNASDTLTAWNQTGGEEDYTSTGLVVNNRDRPRLGRGRRPRLWQQFLGVGTAELGDTDLGKEIFEVLLGVHGGWIVYRELRFGKNLWGEPIRCVHTSLDLSTGG